MGCDMLVALGRATADGQTIFAMNSDHRLSPEHPICREPRKKSTTGEKVRTQFLVIPEVRETCAVVAVQPSGWWGYAHGINEHGVVMGASVLRTMLQCPEPGLTGGDLVRLALERSHSARHAVECVTALIERYGQTASPGQCGPYGSDHGFLIADAGEVFAVETAGRHWVYQEIHEVRAASNASVIHQDWDGISRGLAGSAIDRGWWPADGTKLDYASAVSRDPVGQASGLRRWGRATTLLEQQNGHIDHLFLRRLLGDHYEGTHYEVEPNMPSRGPVPLCQHGDGPDHATTRSSVIVQLSGDASHLLVVWCAFGSPCQNVYFPVFLDGELPEALTGAGDSRSVVQRLERLEDSLRELPRRFEEVRHAFAALQARLDREATEFITEGAAVKKAGDTKKFAYLAGAFMQHAVERFESLMDEIDVRLSPASNSFTGALSDRRAM